MWETIWTILIGFVAGLLARVILPGRSGLNGFFTTALVGVIGSFIGYYGGLLLGLENASQGVTFLGQIIGAIVAIIVFGQLTKNKTA